MDKILKIYRTQAKKLQVEYKNMQQIAITECAFTDDVVILFANSEEELWVVSSWT